MTRTIDELDKIAHDPTQTTLASFARGARGPYPAHPHGGSCETNTTRFGTQSPTST